MPDLAPTFRNFLFALFGVWYRALTFVLAVPFTVASALAPSGTWQRIALALAALACAVVAPYLAWRDERMRRNEMDTNLVERDRAIDELQRALDANRPAFTTRFEQVMLATSNASNPNSPCVMAIVTVLNSGAPSVLLDWTMGVEYGGEHFHPRLTEIPSLTLPVSKAGERHVTYSLSDFIHKKSASPIPAGGMVTGLLFGVIPSDQAGRFDRIVGLPGIHFNIAFKDVLSEIHEANWTSHGNDSGLAGFGQMNPTVT